MPKVSIIIPVYNCEKHLTECIESILSQTLHEFELILVDDGSKDKSSEICDMYSNQDKRIKVFHKENGGVSSARNYGLKFASGEYFAFVDSDDTIVNTMYEHMYCAAKNTM
ncbi:MAG: glycosyltransferase [Clostridia bacterium]|nr:glycosyltransferase [Clostridia bacterium]